MKIQVKIPNQHSSYMGFMRKIETIKWQGSYDLKLGSSP